VVIDPTQVRSSVISFCISSAYRANSWLDTGVTATSVFTGRDSTPVVLVDSCLSLVGFSSISSLDVLGPPFDREFNSIGFFYL